jgi:hypothetical protein
MIQLFKRKELLKIIKRNGWPENEGIEEIPDLENVEMEGIAERIRWTKERGNWDKPLDEI